MFQIIPPSYLSHPQTVYEGEYVTGWERYGYIPEYSQVLSLFMLLVIHWGGGNYFKVRDPDTISIPVIESRVVFEHTTRMREYI